MNELNGEPSISQKKLYNECLRDNLESTSVNVQHSKTSVVGLIIPLSPTPTPKYPHLQQLRTWCGSETTEWAYEIFGSSSCLTSANSISREPMQTKSKLSHSEDDHRFLLINGNYENSLGITFKTRFEAIRRWATDVEGSGTASPIHCNVCWDRSISLGRTIRWSEQH